MERQAAFAGSRPLLKGALHCHTTRSDGLGTPEEVIRLHAAHGYDFMALTDHRLYNHRNYAPDVRMTILPGMEVDRNLGTAGVHCYHVVAVGPTREAGNGFAQDEPFDTGRVSGQAEMQAVLDTLHAGRNLTLYCHPEWSGTPAHEFENLQGLFAMEIWNTGCAMENDLDTNNAACWDELLLKGKRLYGVATDDGHKMAHHCKGWVRVNAENDVQSILEALAEGAFYASCGPEIHDFTIENGVAKLACSPCKYIWFRHGYLPGRQTMAEDGSLTGASFEVPPWVSYLRAIVMDAQGRRAWTNPIFLDGR